MKKTWIILFVSLVQIIAVSGMSSAHCQLPCGIYDDQMRIQMIYEDTKTMERAMKQIEALGKESPINYNQLVRWTVNKEDHAKKIQEVVSQYFMAQRIKPDQEKYIEKLQLLHKMLITAMKCRQTIDLDHIESLRELTRRFEKLYMGHKHD